MSSEPPIDPELTAVARRLADFVPAPADLPRDLLMYLAGQAAAERRPRGRAIRALLAAVVLIAGFALGRVAPRDPVIIERVVQVPVEEPMVTATAPVPQAEVEPPAVLSVPSSANNYLLLRDRALLFGVESLPETYFPDSDLPAHPTTLFDFVDRRPAKN